jgi:hypothetical protein
LNEKGFQFCYECADFANHTCEQFEKLAASASNYDEDVRANLARIQADDVDAWLQECEAKFRCAYCGESLPARSFKKQCYHCGKDLGG